MPSEGAQRDESFRVLCCNTSHPYSCWVCWALCGVALLRTRSHLSLSLIWCLVFVYPIFPLLNVMNKCPLCIISFDALRRNPFLLYLSLTDFLMILLSDLVYYPDFRFYPISSVPTYKSVLLT